MVQGEAKEADTWYCRGDGVGLILKRGEIVKKVPEDKILEELKREVEEF